MKVVGIGIFIIMVMGLIFFTIQIVKQVDFKAIPSAQDKTQSLNTFADIKSSITFQYPETWTLQSSGASAQFAPVFKAIVAENAAGYFGISRKELKRYPTSAEDFEFYSEDTAFKSFLNDVIAKDSGIADDEIKIISSSRSALKNGLPGFQVQYSVRNIRGTVYYLYSRDALQMVISAFVSDQAIDAGDAGATGNPAVKNDPLYTNFKASVDALMNTFLTI